MLDDFPKMPEAYGGAGPTTKAAQRQVKGMMFDQEDGQSYRAYWNSDELRQDARELVAVANWLDVRAANESN